MLVRASTPPFGDCSFGRNETKIGDDREVGGIAVQGKAGLRVPVFTNSNCEQGNRVRQWEKNGPLIRTRNAIIQVALFRPEGPAQSYFVLALWV